VSKRPMASFSWMRGDMSSRTKSGDLDGMGDNRLLLQGLITVWREI